MYKLVIVDDEQIIREGIAANTDFGSLNIELVGCCENGLEALEVVKAHQPDIVMTDINMPFMNGLELAEQILHLYPLTKIIFLTGYDRFEYVKQALRLRITDYLVKPILPNEFLKIFKKVTKTLEQERLKEIHISSLIDRVAETEQVLRDRFLNRLTKGKMCTTELMGNLRNHKIDMDLSINNYQALCVSFDQTGMCDSMNYNILDGYLIKALTLIHSYTSGMPDCVVFRTYYDRIAVFIGGEDQCDVTEASELLADKVLSGMTQESGVSISIGKIVKSFEAISQSYKSAEEVLEYRLFSGKHAISSYIDLKKRRGSGLSISLSEYAGAIYREVKSGTHLTLNKRIDEAFDLLRKHTLAVDSYYIHVQSLLTSIILSLEEQGISYSDVTKQTLNPLLKLQKMQTLDEMQVWIKQLCTSIIEYVVEEQEDYQFSQAKAARSYIEAHFSDDDISLKKVCKALGMSVSYFSQIFKEETGKTFVDYLTCLRMEQAKVLLRNTSDKTYEISAAVGYKDSHYFSLVFKKHVGMTATAFRDTISMKSGVKHG